MAGEWASVPLCTIATVKSGKRLPLGQTLTSQRTPHPYVRLVDIDGNRIRKENMQYLEPSTHKAISRYIVRSGDVCLAIVGHTIGLVFQVEEHWDGANLTENAARLTDFRGADPTFVFSYLRSQLGQDLIKSRIVGSAQGKLPLYAIASFPIPLPPLAEQRAIASVLGAFDDKIELNRRMNATLESMARALFQSWFIDFDPVRAKLDNRHPTGMDAETAALFPDSFEHGVDGEIHPKGWIKTTIGDEVIFQTGFSFQSEFFTETPPGIRLARGMNVKEGEFFWSNQSRYWPQVTADIEQYLLRVGDVLIGMDGSKVGKNWVRVRAADLPCLLVQRVARLREADSIGQNFIALLIGSTTFRDFVEAVKTGTSIPHISGGQIKGYSFLRPPRDDNRIFQRFESLVAPMTAQADKNHAEAEILATLRDTLLPKLLSGELSVVGAESAMEKA